MSDRVAKLAKWGMWVALLCGLCSCSASEGTKPDAQASADTGMSGSGSEAGKSDASAAGAGGAAGGRASTASAGSSGAAAADDGEPRWSAIFAHVFTTCRLDSCHGGGLIGLDFSNKDAAWSSLVDQPAAADSACAMLGKKRVLPNQPDESLLYLKLDSDSPCGSQMPPGGQLRQAARDRIRAWIEMGAKND